MSDEDARWMTYEALAQARGTTKRAAVVLVRRKRWPRQTNNAGHVLALVPVSWAQKNYSVQPEELPRHSAPNGASHAIAVLERTVEALREAHAGERAALQAQVEAQATIAAEARMEVAALKIAAEQAEAAAATAEERAERLEAGEAARKARGRWARLRAAWRGE
jgi:hypothetical protein